jgi:hypothetical protein
MTIWYSDQYNNFINNAPSRSQLRPSDFAGRLRVARFTRTAPAASPAVAGDTIALTLLPWNARVLFTVIEYDAEGAGAILTLGDGVTAARFGTSTSLSAGTSQTLFPTTADGVTLVPVTPGAPVSGYIVPAPYMPVIGTFGTAGESVNAKLTGAVIYVVD